MELFKLLFEDEEDNPYGEILDNKLQPYDTKLTNALQKVIIKHMFK
jgi:hypothetical protein